MTDIRTRFAPSPTGFLHIGGLRTALYSYVFAKSKNGKFILRIEDTDQNRLIAGATEKIYEILKKFGIFWDEGPEIGGSFGPYVQSERVKLGIYKQYAEGLVDKGYAYYCFCPPESKEEISERHEKKILKLRDEDCRSLTEQQIHQKLSSGMKPAIRLRVPLKEKVSFYDFVLKKDISWNTEDIDEVMLLKSDGFPTYHLAVVVDDWSMGITHIIRGRDWLPSTPVHLLLYRYLGLTIPQIGHLTDILDPEGGKLAKRKGSVSCEGFLSEGYLPEALLNFIMLLGWAPKDNRELFTLPEFVENFEKGGLQTANPIFNRKKLDWFNGCYIRQKTDNELVELLKPFIPLSFRTTESRSGIYINTLTKVVPLVKDRIIKLSEFQKLAGFIFERPKVDISLFGDLSYKDHIKAALDVLSAIKQLASPDPGGQGGWDNETMKTSLTSLISQENFKTGDFFMSLRIAVSGSRFTPPIVESMEIIGKEETLTRLKLLV